MKNKIIGTLATLALFLASGSAHAAYFGQVLRNTKGGTGSASQTATRAIETDGSGNLVSSSVTATELGYLSGATASIQTQINAISGVDVSGKVDRTGDTMSGGLGLGYSGANTSTAVILDANRKLVSSAVTSTELGYVSGVTGAIQSQLDAKLVASDIAGKVNRGGDTMTGGLGLDYSGANVSTAVVLDGSKKLVSSAVTATELGYLSGATAAVQTQLNAKLGRKRAVSDPGDASHTITASEEYLRVGAPLTASRTWTLPACSSGNIGEFHEVKFADATNAFPLVLAADGSDTIDGAASISFSYPDSVRVVCAVAGLWDVN